MGGKGPAWERGLRWVECQGFQAAVNYDAKREYLISQSERFPLSTPACI